MTFRLLRALAIAGALALLPGVSGAQVEVRTVTVQEVESLRGAAAPPLLLDVRTRSEYEAGHIAGAIHIPYDEIAKRIGELTVPEAGVIVYCQKGPRARKAEQTLLEHGVGRVLHLLDGFSAWSAAGLPVARLR